MAKKKSAKTAKKATETINPYLVEEFEAFLKLLQSTITNKVILGTWRSIATNLGISEDTVAKWRLHPEAAKLEKEAREYALLRMMEVGSDDWKMWEKQAKMLGVDFGDQKLDVTSGGEPITFGWKK